MADGNSACQRNIRGLTTASPEKDLSRSQLGQRLGGRINQVKVTITRAPTATMIQRFMRRRTMTPETQTLSSYG